MGGLPPWLLWEYTNITLRSSDQNFMAAVSKWFGVLLPKLRPYLYVNGGPIIMLQIENEYGSYACDLTYKELLRDLIESHLGKDVVLFTTDPPTQIQLDCGSLTPGVHPTTDFGPESLENVDKFLNELRRLTGPPLVNSEFYTAWMDHWGSPHNHNRNRPDEFIATLDHLLGAGVSVNIYLFHGGTSFGFASGASIFNETGKFQPCVTSYDYDAPLTEAGDPTRLYFAIKHTISKYKSVPIEDPKASPKGNYGKIELIPLVAILDEAMLRTFAPHPVIKSHPLTFESLKVKTGFVLYETEINFVPTDPIVLQVRDLRDRAYIFIGKDPVGVLSRSEEAYSLPILAEKGQLLQILVESQGRPSFGSHLAELKGISGPIRLGSHELNGSWTNYGLGDLNGRKLLKFAIKKLKTRTKDEFNVKRRAGMTYMATFVLGNSTHPNPYDTFIRFDGWKKGNVWINNVNLGRYWPGVGPQETLYMPSALLNPYPAKNYLILLELERVPNACFARNQCFVEFTDQHIIDGLTPN